MPKAIGAHDEVDECFSCDLYDDGKCRTRFLLKMVHGDDFPIVGCGVREDYMRSKNTEEAAVPDAAEENR